MPIDSHTLNFLSFYTFVSFISLLYLHFYSNIPFLHIRGIFFIFLINVHLACFHIYDKKNTFITFQSGLDSTQNTNTTTANNAAWAGYARANTSSNTFIGDQIITGSIKNTGGMVIPVKKLTGNYSITASLDHVLAFNGSNLTASLPSATSNNGSTFVIKNNHSTNLHITSSIAGLIDGQTSAVIDRQYNSYKLVSDGTDWLVI